EARRRFPADREQNGEPVAITAADGSLLRGPADRHPWGAPGLSARHPHGAERAQGVLPDQSLSSYAARRRVEVGGWDARSQGLAKRFRSSSRPSPAVRPSPRARSRTTPSTPAGPG